MIAEKQSDGTYQFSNTSYDTAISGLLNEGKKIEAQKIVKNILAEIIIKLANENIDCSYEQTYDIFPLNRGFMHGADKLLAVIIAVISCGEFKNIIATNASLSKGMCRLIIEKPNVIKSLTVERVR